MHHKLIRKRNKTQKGLPASQKKNVAIVSRRITSVVTVILGNIVNTAIIGHTIQMNVEILNLNFHIADAGGVPAAGAYIAVSVGRADITLGTGAPPPRAVAPTLGVTAAITKPPEVAVYQAIIMINNISMITKQQQIT